MLKCKPFLVALFLLPSMAMAMDIPGADNTGPTSDISELTPYTGRTTINADGTVIENFTFNGILRINANNVTIRNCVMSGEGTYGIHIYDGTTGTVIEDCIIENMKSAGILGSNFTASRLEIRNSGADAIKASNNYTIEDSWFHSLGYLESAHADGIQMRQGSNAVIRGNHFDMPYNVEGYRNSQCMIIQTGDGPIDNVLIEGNWLNGGNYCVQIRDVKKAGFGAPTNVTLINNQFGTDYQFGPIISDTDDMVEYGNVYDVSKLSNIIVTPAPGEIPVEEPVVVEETFNATFTCTVTGPVSAPSIDCGF